MDIKSKKQTNGTNNKDISRAYCCLRPAEDQLKQAGGAVNVVLVKVLQRSPHKHAVDRLHAARRHSKLRDRGIYFLSPFMRVASPLFFLAMNDFVFVKMFREFNPYFAENYI